MKTAANIVVSVFLSAGPVCVTPAAADPVPKLSYVGEVRAFAIASGNSQAIVQLHRDGWLEAHGQLLSVRECQAPYKIVGRTWTADGVADDRFAVPDGSAWALVRISQIVRKRESLAFSAFNIRQRFEFRPLRRSS